MSTPIVFIILMILAIIMGLYAFMTSKSNKEIEDLNETKKIAEEIKEKLSKNKVNNLMNGKGVSRNGGGIIKERTNKQSTSPQSERKPTSWKETSSYEEDIRTVNLDNIVKPKKDTKETRKKDENQEVKTLNLESFIKPKKDAHKEQELNYNKPLVLLVDDSMVVRKYVGDLLKKANYEIVLKNDGWEAITYLNSSSQKPDLIISDIEMPNMNGFQLIDAIRKEKRYKNVPILVISAHAESHLILMEKESIQGFIKKPFEDSDLLNQVEFLLQA